MPPTSSSFLERASVAAHKQKEVRKRIRRGQIENAYEVQNVPEKTVLKIHGTLLVRNIAGKFCLHFISAYIATRQAEVFCLPSIVDWLTVVTEPFKNFESRPIASHAVVCRKGGPVFNKTRLLLKRTVDIVPNSLVVNFSQISCNRNKKIQMAKMTKAFSSKPRQQIMNFLMRRYPQSISSSY